MNPFDYVLDRSFGPYLNDQTGVEAATVALLRVLSADYTAGFTGKKAAKYVLDAIEPYAPGAYMTWLCQKLNTQVEAEDK